jgi:hypothetical protein
MDRFGEACHCRVVQLFPGRFRGSILDIQVFKKTDASRIGLVNNPADLALNRDLWTSLCTPPDAGILPRDILCRWAAASEIRMEGTSP